MPTFTVPGGSNNGVQQPPITYTYASGAGLSVAQQIANALAASGTLSVTSSSGGTIPAPTTVSGTTQDLVLTGNPTSSIPAGYNFIENDVSGPTTITAAAGTSIISSTGGGLFVETGPATIAASGGNNVISQTGAGAILLASGGGNNTITAAGTSGTVAGGLGANLINESGSGVTVLSTGGTDTINSSGSGNLIVGTSSGPGSMSVNETGSNDTILGGTNPMTVTATTATRVYAGAGSLTFVGGAGTATVLGGTGSESLTAGSGGIVFADNTAPSATINGSSGTVTIFGSSGASDFLTGTAGTAASPDFLIAGAGNETLNGSGNSGAQFLAMGSASVSASLIAGSGADTLVAGSGPGSATMTGGSGSDTFVFFKQAAGGAKDVVNNFTPNDSVFIEGYAAGSAAALLQAATVGAGGVTLTLSDGTSVTFSNLTSPSQLSGKIQYG
jgi:Ca2+-binding RTX toxin-like protein